MGMIKSKIAIVIDSLTVSLISFVVALAWLGRHILQRKLLLAVSAILAVAVFFLVYLLSAKSANRQKLSGAELKKMEACHRALQYLSRESESQYFQNLLGAKRAGGKIFKGKDINYYVETRQALTASDFISANEYFMKYPNTPLCFICWEFDEKFAALAEGCSTAFKVFNSAALFKFMSERALFPPQAELSSERQSTLKKLGKKYRGGISRAHFKDFFFSGLALLAVSIVSPYHNYYYMFGTALMVLAIVCLFSKKVKTKLNDSESISAYLSSIDHK